LSEEVLRARPDAIGEARKYVRDRLADILETPQLYDAELLTSELVTNAVRHPIAGEDALIRIGIEVDPRTVRVSVVDAGEGFDVSKVASKPPDNERGWGLVLIEAVADRWGIDASPPHSVWFEIDR
jgi:anti-sigma regulatory factor (Ser/Thr protein kinase)